MPMRPQVSRSSWSILQPCITDRGEARSSADQVSHHPPSGPIHGGLSRTVGRRSPWRRCYHGAWRLSPTGVFTASPKVVPRYLLHDVVKLLHRCPPVSWWWRNGGAGATDAVPLQVALQPCSRQKPKRCETGRQNDGEPRVLSTFSPAFVLPTVRIAAE